MKLAHVPATSDRLWARAVDHAVIALFLIPAFGWRAFAPLALEETWLPWGIALYLVLAPIAYETLAIWLFGTTVGKWVFSLHVISSRPGVAHIGFWDSLTRTVVNSFSMLVSYAGYSLMFLKTDRTHWGDWLAKTRVVCTRERRDPARPRPVLAIVLIHLFALAGMASAMAFLQGVTLQKSGVLIAPISG